MEIPDRKRLRRSIRGEAGGGKHETLPIVVIPDLIRDP
jgi:hypothetical protein